MNDEFLRVLQAELRGDDPNPGFAWEFFHLDTNPQGPSAQRLHSLLKKPPPEDTPIQTIYETPFVKGEIVVAGAKTRKTNHWAAARPLHFKKTYKEVMSRWETPTSHEWQQSWLVYQHFLETGAKNRVPLPLGAEPKTFRSELIPAKALATICPIHNGEDPKEVAAQIQCAITKHTKTEKLWRALESLWEATSILHAGGLIHGDLHNHNLMVAETPHGPRGMLIDFETTIEDERFQTLQWETAKKEDRRLLVEEAALTRLCSSHELPKTTPLAHETIQYLRTNPKMLAIQNILTRENPKTAVTLE
jgi:hypothetical protein